jgi:gliding motility-associated-like protein
MDNSKLYIHTVIPAATNIAVVDENTNPDNTFGSAYDYAFNTNTWRAEVSVPNNPLRQDIVTVLQPGSKTTLKEMVTTPMQTTQNNMEGTMIAANGKTEVVLFNNSVARYPAPVTLASYSFTGLETVNHTLCGLDPNKKYAVHYSNGVITATESTAGAVTASPSGVLSFTLQSLGLTDNATLASLAINNGTLAPVFEAGTTTYTVAVANTVATVRITPKTSNADATIKVNGVTVASGAASAAIPLTVGPNTITTVVTAVNGTTKLTYTVTVTRAASNNASLLRMLTNRGALTPAFTAATTSYTKSVTNAITSIIITPTTSVAGAAVTVNGMAVASGTASASIPLAVGNTTITTLVTAPDGVTQKTYTLTVTRATGALSVGNNTEHALSAVNSNDGIIVHQAVSPNGDGVNDQLIIEGINNYPDNKLTIMNRAGALVYEAKGYDNISKPFEGRSNKTGKMQQAGTYFYTLEYKVGGVTRRKTGFIVLKY